MDLKPSYVENETLETKFEQRIRIQGFVQLQGIVQPNGDGSLESYRVTTTLNYTCKHWVFSPSSTFDWCRIGNQESRFCTVHLHAILKEQ